MKFLTFTSEIFKNKLLQAKFWSILLRAKFSRICYYIYDLKLLGERLVCLNLYEVFLI